MSRLVFVDSAAWIALLHSGDGLHARVVEVYRQLIDDGRELLTTSLVLVEVASAFAAPTRRRLATQLEERYRRTEIGALIWIDENLYQRGWELYRARPDEGWSLVDCTSFIVMRAHGITEVLTSDHHFEQAAFTRLI